MKAAEGETMPATEHPAAPPHLPTPATQLDPQSRSQPDQAAAYGSKTAIGMRAGALALLRKELQLEARTMESIPAMTLFSLSAFVIFHFALNRGSLEGDLAAGVLWVSILLASLLAINRLFVADAEQGGFDALQLAPVPASALLLAKVLTLLLYIVILELIAVPAFTLLLLAHLSLRSLPSLALALALGDLAIAIIGTLISALVVRSRARDLLGPLLALPLLIPAVIGAASAISPLLAARGPAIGAWLSGAGGRWTLILALYDLLFGLIAFALFDFLLED